MSWAPAQAPGAIFQPAGGEKALVKKLVSGGCDNMVKIWTCQGDT